MIFRHLTELAIVAGAAVFLLAAVIAYRLSSRGRYAVKQALIPAFLAAVFLAIRLLHGCFAAKICSLNVFAPYVAQLPEPTGWGLVAVWILGWALVMLFINMLVTTYVLPPVLGLFAAGNLFGRAIWLYVNRGRSVGDPPASTGANGDGAKRPFGQKP